MTDSSQPVRYYTGQPQALISIAGLRRGDPTAQHYGESIAYSHQSNNEPYIPLADGVMGLVVTLRWVCRVPLPTTFSA